MHGNLTCRGMYEQLMGLYLQLDWSKLLWNKFIPPSCAMFFWRLFHGKILIEEDLIH